MSENVTRTVPLYALLSVVRDGDEIGWDVEFNELWQTHADRLDMLATSIQETGIRVPILIGADGRVWDGHHRLAVAEALGLSEVPIVWAGEPTGEEKP